MKKSNKFLLVLSSLFVAISLASCGQDKADSIVTKSSVTTIHILHQEDYMDERLLTAFEKSENNKVKIVFDTTDTNETLYNELKTGKADYNLVTVSEYMIQRMAGEGLVQKINFNKDGAYLKNVSPWLTNKDHTGRIDGIKVKDAKTNEELGVLSDFTAGYMWGTLGTVVNPNYKVYQDRGMKKEDIVSKLRGIDGWSSFWDPAFKGTHSIKESMRDTYALGIFELFKDEFLDPSISYDDKNSKYFNDHSKDTINDVKDLLIDLKGNIFGFEVDSGKNDIVTGKIGMNLAWSGDAAFSILKGDFEPGPDEDYTKPKEHPTNLYYNIPKIGSNIWFDGFAMPKTTDPNSKEYEYTLKFIDFISEPENVVANMSYTGFTSFISGVGLENNPVVDFVIDTFDTPSEDRSSKHKPYNLSYFFNNGTTEDLVVYVDPDSFEGRMIVAQYPELSDIDHLYVMEDYGADNGKIVQMWEDIKVNPLPLWIDIFLISFFVILISYFGAYKIIKAHRVKKRKELRKQD